MNLALRRLNPRLRSAASRRAGARKGGGSFIPTQVPAVSSWLRLATSTINAGEYDTIANVKVPSNPTNQADADRKPEATISANGYPTCTWDGTDIVVWPIVASNNSTTKWGLMVWIKPTSTGSRQRILHGNAGSNVNRVNVDIVSGGLAIGFMNTGGANGQVWEQFTCIAANVWQCIRVQFDGSLSGNDNIMQVFKNEVKITGAVFTPIGTGALTAMHAPTGDYLIGGGVLDQDAVIAPLLSGTQTGPNWFVFNATPTPAEAVALMNYERPSDVATFAGVGISAVSGWLRLAASAAVGGEWPTIVDVINAGSPMVQTDTDRRTAVGAAPNGLPTMVWDGTDVHLWPLVPAHSSTTKVGFWFWYKRAAVGDNPKLYFATAGLSGGAFNRLQLQCVGAALRMEVLVTSSTGRQGSAAGFFTAGAWHAIYIQYDSSRGGDANLAIYKNGVLQTLTWSNIGAGATLTVLQTGTGSAVIGGGSDVDAPDSPIVNGDLFGPNIFAFNDNLTAAQIAILLAFEAPAPVIGGLAMSSVSGWLRLAASTPVGGEWSTVVDVLNAGSPMVQTDTDRRTAVSSSANALPTMVFDGTAVMLWPISPAHSSTTKVGIWFWYKPASVATTQVLLAAHTPLSAKRLAMYTSSTSIIVEAYITNADGRYFNTVALTAGVWHAIYLQYDSSRGGDANVALYVNGVLKTLGAGNIGAGGTLGALQAATGNALIGAGTDLDTPSSPVVAGAEFGPNIFAMSDNLTAAEIAAMLSHEAPT